jgi:hypothetical protein
MPFNLISCNNIYPSIIGVSSPSFTSYIGSVVEIGNPNQSYTVESVGSGSVNLGDITITELQACAPCVPFDTKIGLEFDCCDCNSFSITDESLYSNSIMGYEVNGYRKIIVTDPNGNQYVFSSLETDNPDTEITTYVDLGNSQFTYSFLADAVDGVYEIKMYSFPLWNEDVFYQANLNHVVFYDGALYQIVASGTNNLPDADGNEFWTPYTITDETLTTRYGEVKHKTVLCIKLESCKDRMLKEAFCSTESNPCGNLCDNKKFQQTMKYSVTLEAIRIKECSNDWVGVKKGIEILKSICSCGGC